MTCIGGWHVTVDAALSWSIAFGFELRLLSWRSAYPWVRLYVGLGPFLLVVDGARPPDGEFVRITTL
jgi:hypothetical protein